MRSQRGSATVIALAMMMFLLIVGVGWLPMMAQENKEAAMDEQEQKAWYAAEAGYNRAKIELLNGGQEWTWLSSSVSNLSWQKVLSSEASEYAVYISPTLSGLPNSTYDYAITAVGRNGDLRKVIKRTIAHQDLSHNVQDAIIVAGGAIAATGKQTFEAGTSVSGILASNGVINPGNSEHLGGSGSLVVNGLPVNYNDMVYFLFTSIFNASPSPLASSNYFDGSPIGVTSLPDPVEGNIYLAPSFKSVSNISVANNKNALLYQQSISTDSSTSSLSISGGINVGKGGVLLIIASDNIALTGNITGDVFITTPKQITINNLTTGTGTRVYILAGDKITINKSTISRCFAASGFLNPDASDPTKVQDVKANASITLFDDDITGQFFSKGDVYFGSTCTFTGDGSVLNSFGFPIDVLEMFKID